ncbi:MAG: Gfo/Idh/MocA family oxidoreductase [bacterium]|nr:Gfo/Idh/MocA family oxidoreductase [bacterium]
MTKHTLSIGIIGTGMIGTKHIRDFNSVPGSKVTAIADLDPERLENLAEEYAIPETATDYREVLRLPDLDAVVVCVPPHLQEQICTDALKAGKHVLCEKPMAMTARSAQRMVKIAKKYKKILACCASRFLFSPTVIRAKEMIERGELGAIYHISMVGISRRYRPCLEYHTNCDWGLDKAKAGGGVLMDWGIYDLGILYGLLPSLAVHTVEGFCFQGIDHPAREGLVFNVEEHGGAALRCADGLVVFWERAWAAHMTSRPRVRIYGSKAGLSFDPLALTKDIFFELYEDRSGKPVTVAPDMNQEKWDIHKSVAFDFVEAVKGLHPPKIGGEAMIKYLQIIEAVYRSSAKKKGVRV